MAKRGRITERSLYPAIKDVFKNFGATSVQEVKFGTQPDIVADWLGEKWLISVKIGDPTRQKLLKDAFMQYVNHVLDSGIKYGMIIFYPEEIRNVEPDEQAIHSAVENTEAYFLVVNPQMELRKTLAEALEEIKSTLQMRIPTVFSLKTVVRILKDHITDIMKDVKLKQTEITKIITDPELFFGISYEKKKKEEIFKFLASYIFLSQVLFLRLYSTEHPTILEGFSLSDITKESVKTVFSRILDINYRPIFELDVIDVIPLNFVQDTIKLIWGLQIEKIRYELPGRLFHELMPDKIRKLLAAFYTRPIAADLLANLTIDNPDVTVFDPACGSGTILTAAYKRKLNLWIVSGRKENPHRIFCEEHLYGADIMPFAVHLTGANLAAMDPKITLNKVQVILGDSLKLSPDGIFKPGYKSLLEFIGFDEEPEKTNTAKAFTVSGKSYEIVLKRVDVVMMNPPFTKVERGIKKYIEMDRFSDIVGGEVGLWGHFIALADLFLKEGGIFGGVIPINILRGRESEKVRKLVFKKWLPLYIIKATRNYGFSEWTEYRDVLIIAKKTKDKPQDHKVKFCLIKKDLTELTEEDVKKIAELIKTSETVRSELVDVNSHTLEEIEKSFENLMPFISGTSFDDKDALNKIIQEAKRVLCYFPKGYFREAYRPVPRGVSKFMFITRPTGEGRLEEAFLILEREDKDKIIAKTPANVQKFTFSKKHFLPSLRTPVGLNTMDVTGKHDYVAKEPYENLEKVLELCGFKGELTRDYWSGVQRELESVKTNVVIVRRINPFSPNQKLIAFFSDYPISPSNQFNVIVEKDKNVGKAVAVLLNSIFFLANFFNLKEESTGRYIDVRFYDLYMMKLYPTEEQVEKLVKVYEKFKDIEFPSLTKQLDEHFEERYKQFWAKERGKQETLAELPDIKPNKLRYDYDMAVARALGVDITEEDLIRAYQAIVNDMIITRGLKRD